MAQEGIVAENIPIVDLKDMGYDCNNLDLVKFVEDRKQRVLKVTENQVEKGNEEQGIDRVINNISKIPNAMSARGQVYKRK
jgi:hypothetical protein